MRHRGEKQHPSTHSFLLEESKPRNFQLWGPPCPSSTLFTWLIYPGDQSLFGALYWFGGGGAGDSGTARSSVDLARSEPSRTNQSAVSMASVRASAVMKQWRHARKNKQHCTSARFRAFNRWTETQKCTWATDDISSAFERKYNSILTDSLCKRHGEEKLAFRLKLAREPIRAR